MEGVLTVKNGCFEFWRTLFSVSVCATSSWKKKKEKTHKGYLCNSYNSKLFRYQSLLHCPLKPQFFFTPLLDHWQTLTFATITSFFRIFMA